MPARSAYVTMRGTAHARQVTRTATPGAFAALAIAHPDGSTTRFEFTYMSLPSGETMVDISRTNPGRETVTLLREVVSGDGR